MKNKCTFAMCTFPEARSKFMKTHAFKTTCMLGRFVGFQMFFTASHTHVFFDPKKRRHKLRKKTPIWRSSFCAFGLPKLPKGHSDPTQWTPEGPIPSFGGAKGSELAGHPVLGGDTVQEHLRPRIHLRLPLLVPTRGFSNVLPHDASLNGTHESRGHQASLVASKSQETTRSPTFPRMLERGSLGKLLLKWPTSRQV